MRRRLLGAAIVAAVVVVAAAPAPAWACGGLVNPNGTVSLVKTTTFAGYRWGVEHYVTSFEFAGGGAEFGSIVPLPGIPKKVTRAGDWTLQRLVREVAPPRDDAEGGPPAPSAGGEADVIYETEIDSLKITILRGGARGVGKWAKNNGFSLTPDAPEVLDFYAQRSRIFMAARFDPKKARKDGKSEGDGVPIHLRIPTDNPWVPLRILGLGLPDDASVQADVFLLTRNAPSLAPEPAPAGSDTGVILERSEEASESLLSDLNSDKGMRWLPGHNMWLSYLKVDTTAGELKFDLATNVKGGEASEEEAGLGDGSGSRREAAGAWTWLWASFLGVGGAAAFRRYVVVR